MVIKEEVLAYLEKQNPVPGSSEEEKLACSYLDQGVIDSLGIVNMIGDFEDKFNIRFESEDLQSQEFQTVGGLVGIIERLAAKSNSSN